MISHALRRSLTGAALAALTLGAASPSLAGDRALIIGINEYMNSDADLTLARNDALKFRSFVIDHLGFAPEEVVTLLDTEATGANVRSAIVDHLIEGSEPGDRVVFYFSGHGSRVRDGSGDEADGYDEVVVLSDAHVDIRSGVLFDDEFDRYFSALRDRHALLVFDSCNSGTIHRSAADDPVYAMRYTDIAGADGMDRTTMPAEMLARSNAEAPLDGAPDNRMIWTASAAAQPAWEDRRSGGVFTTHFLAGLIEGRADANGNGRITNAELLSYISRHTERACASNPNCDKGFTPTFTGPPEALAGLLVPAGHPGPAQQLAEAPTPEAPTPEATPGPTTPAPATAPPASSPAKPNQQAQAVDPSKPNQQSAPPAAQLAEAPTTETPSQPAETPAPNYVSAPSTPEPGLFGQTTPQSTPGTPTSPLAVLSDVFATQNEAGVTLRLTPGRDLRLGETVSMEITANRPGTLVLFDLDPQGNLYQLFPSRLSAPGVGRIRPGQVLRIPEARSVNGRLIQITVTEPAGRGQLMALLIEDSATLHTPLRVLPQDVAPGPIPDASIYLLTLARGLQSVQASAEGNQSVRWSAATAEYVIRR